MSIIRRTFAAIVSAIVAGILAVSAPAAAGATSLKEPDVLAPGVQYINVNRDTNCTLGFKVTNSALDQFITAGHCGDVGDRVAVIHKGSLVDVGYFTKSTPYDGYGEDDLGIITMNTDMPMKASLATGNDSSAPVDYLTLDDMDENRYDVFKIGHVTGLTGGPWVRGVGFSMVDYMTPTRNGDSGGPFFVIGDDGSIYAAGIMSGSPDDLHDHSRMVTLDSLIDEGIRVS